MKTNPFMRALAASAYIAVVASIFFFGSTFAPQEDSVLAPMAMLSLLVLSVSVMGYIFILEPLRMFLDGKREEGVQLFMKTVGYFGVITLTIFLVLFML